MSALRVACLLAVLTPACRHGTSGPVAPKPSASCAPAADGVEPFDVAAHPDFARYESALRTYAARATAAPSADFCIVGLVHPEWRAAQIVWRGGDRIITWFGGASELAEGKELDLKTDVVASEDDVRGSTFLVTKRWVDEAIRTCACFGRTVHVTLHGDRVRKRP